MEEEENYAAEGVAEDVVRTEAHREECRGHKLPGAVSWEMGRPSLQVTIGADGKRGKKLKQVDRASFCWT